MMRFCLIFVLQALAFTSLCSGHPKGEGQPIVDLGYAIHQAILNVSSQGKSQTMLSTHNFSFPDRHRTSTFQTFGMDELQLVHAASRHRFHPKAEIPQSTLVNKL
jgi:hypothetical protein